MTSLKCYGSQKNTVGKCGPDSSDSGQRLMSNSCEHCNEPSGSIKVGEFPD
jgi:hypothetical protein